MPIYNYKCTCGKSFSKIKKYGDRDDVVCECGNKCNADVSANIPDTAVYDRVNNYTGKQVLRGVSRILYDRYKEHSQEEAEVGAFVEEHGFRAAVDTGRLTHKKKVI